MAVPALAVLLLLAKAFSRPPFFDETMHVRYLWMLSSGLVPGKDFFCNYPALGYILATPWMRALPESAAAVEGLRLLSVALACLTGLLFFRHGRRVCGSGAAGLLPYALVAGSPAMAAFFSEYSIDPLAAAAAVGAMGLFFGKGTPRAAVAGGFLCLLSVAFTPKYAFPLCLGLAGFLASMARNGRRLAARGVAAAAAGGLAAVLLALAAYGVAGVSLWDNVRMSHVLMARYMAQGAEALETAPPSAVAWDVVRNDPFLACLLAAGVAGWALRMRRGYRLAWLPGAGVLAGAACGAWVSRHVLSVEQFQAPVLLCLATFFPFACPDPSDGARARWILAAFSLVAAALLLSRVPDAVRGFGGGPVNVRDRASVNWRYLGRVMSPPLSKVQEDCDRCLALVPRDERVLAVGYGHPLFRRDVSRVVNDESGSGRSFADVMDPGDPRRSWFSPEAFARSLERFPPALVAPALAEFNLPPGWKAVCDDYLASRRSSYSLVKLESMGAVFVRNDLLARGAPGAGFRDVDDLARTARVFLGAGKVRDAAACLEVALRNRPDSPGLRVALGEARERMGDMEGAAGQYREALALRPGDGDARRGLERVMAKRRGGGR